jgi:hypothetical protein
VYVGGNTVKHRHVVEFVMECTLIAALSNDVLISYVS